MGRHWCGSRVRGGARVSNNRAAAIHSSTLSSTPVDPRYVAASKPEPQLSQTVTAVPSTAAERLAAVRREIAAACREAKRDPASVTLVAISKTFGVEAIAPVIAAGQTVFGENRVQEAKAKWPALKAQHPAIELHLVGPLQSNKAKEAVALFEAIHSVDRPSLAEALAKEIARQGRQPTLFVEVNTGAEAQKAGVLPEETDAFVKACRETYGLTIAGLMCIPPADEPPAPHFALTAKIARRNGLKLLSMGMSADYALAVEFGATHVRVGTAIFGQRT
jgi:pyridoxal phosphate enzyme (YggS family)